MKRAVLLTLALASLAAPAPAFVLLLAQAQGGGKWYPERWSERTQQVEFVVSDLPLDLLRNFTTNSDPVAAAAAAVQTWAFAPPGFSFGGPVSQTDVGRDGVNLITLADTAANRDLVTDANARTFPWLGSKRASQQYWPLLETDVVVSPTKRWDTNGDANSLDLQSTLTHELGHCLGLDHTPVCAATMFAFGSRGQTHRRSPEADDMTGVRVLYGMPLPDSGAITGRVLTTAGDPILGAHVAAVDADGAIPVGTLSEKDGSFKLPALIPGDYQVYAEPLAGSFTPKNVVTSYYKGIRTDFRMAFAGDPVPIKIAVTAGNTTDIDPIRVDPQAPTIIPMFIGWSRDGRSWQSLADAVQIAAGKRSYLVVDGAGVDTVTDARVTGADVSLDTSRVRSSTDSLGDPYFILPLLVSAHARPGARTLVVQSDTETAVMTGCIKVVAP